MSSQAAVIESPALPVEGRRRPLLAGAWLLSGAMLLSGLLTYAFHVLAARSLGPDAYGQVAVLWAAMFIVAVILFRPLEQTTSRAIADRLARGDEIRTVLRSVTTICGALLLGLAAASALAWEFVTDRLFLGSDAMTAMLLGGIAVYGLVYVVRGLLGGARWFAGYGLGLTFDALVRLAIAIPLVFAASQNVAAAAVAAAGLAAIIVPLWVGRRRLRPLLGPQLGERFHLASALAFAAPASLIAGADQLLVNGGALLVMLGGGAGASKAAGVVFAATMLVRVPVYLFQGLAASLLPNLTRLQALEDTHRFHQAVIRTAGVLLGTGGLILAFAAIFGPQAMEILYGSDFAAGRRELVLLGAGVGCYLAAATITQALLALDEALRASLAWTASASLFVAGYVVAPGEELARVSLAFVLAALTGLVLVGAVLLRSVRRR